MRGGFQRACSSAGPDADAERGHTNGPVVPANISYTRAFTAHNYGSHSATRRGNRNGNAACCGKPWPVYRKTAVAGDTEQYRATR